MLRARFKGRNTGHVVTELDLEVLERRILLNGAAGFILPKLVIEQHPLGPEEVDSLKDHIGVASEGTDYNILVNGHGTGFRPPTEDEWNEMIGSLQVVDSLGFAEGYDRLSASTDWSDSVYFPPIGSQDGEGSCTAWSVAYYTKTFQEAMEHDWDLSTVSWQGGYYGQPDSQLDHIFSPDFIYHQINGGYDGGSWFEDAVDVIDQIGASTWLTMPYDPLDSTTWPSEAAWREAAIYRGDGSISYLDVSSSVDELKNLLAGGNLAQMAIDCSDMYEMATLDNFYNSYINHAQTIVGYDDGWAYQEQGEARYGAFKVANSWGETWVGEENNDGCWWISYEALRQRVGGVMFFEDLSAYRPELVAVFGMDHRIRGDTTVTVGVGGKEVPLATKEFISPARSCDGNDSFPANLMVLDITEFAGTFEVPFNFFLEVVDTGTRVTGTITDFSIEQYLDYFGGVPDLVGTSTDTPVATQQGLAVYAETLLGGGVVGVDLIPYGASLDSNRLYGFTSGELSYSVFNVGDTAFGDAFEVEFYLSDDGVLGDDNDHFIASDTVAGGMEATSSYSASIEITDFPGGDPFATDGDYYLLFLVDAGDAVSEVHEDNNVQDISVTWSEGLIFYDDFSTDKGWTGYEEDEWERGPAQEGGGEFGFPDPGYDTTRTDDEYLLGYDIGGDYENYMWNTIWIASPVIDCSGVTDVELTFQRWLNVETPWYDEAHIEVYDGAAWQSIFVNNSEITDSSWRQQQPEVSQYADGNGYFRIRFGMGPTDSSWRYSGWNIDDLQVVGTLPGESVAPQVTGLNIRRVVSTPVTSIVVHFSENMALYPLLDVANYSLVDETQQPVSIDAVHAGGDFVTLDINGGVPLQSGDYTLALAAGGLVDSWGNPLDGDGDGVGGDDYIFDFTFKLPGLHTPTMTLRPYGGQITFYDTDAQTLDEIDVRPVALVKGNSTVGITQVVLLPQYSEFGVVVEQMAGSDQPVAIYDRTFYPTPITYIVAACDVSVLSLRSNLTGMDVNGTQLGSGFYMPLDADGDGLETDPVSFYGFGNVRAFYTNATVTGDPIVEGNLGHFIPAGAYSGVDGDVKVGGDLAFLGLNGCDLSGDLTVGGRLGTFRLTGNSDMLGDLTAGSIGSLLFYGSSGLQTDVHSFGDIDYVCSVHEVTGSIEADGHIGRLLALNGVGAGGSVNAGNGLGLFYSRADVLGPVTVTGRAETITVVGDLSGELTVDGSVGTLNVIRGRVTSNVEVDGNIGTMRVVGPRLGGDVVEADVDLSGRLDTLIVSGGDFTGDLTAGDLGNVYYLGPTGVTGTIESAGGLDRLYVRSGISGTVTTAGAAGSIRSTGLSGTVDIGDDLDSLFVINALTGNVRVQGNLGSATVIGAPGMAGAAINVGGHFGSLTVVGHVDNSDIVVGGRLSRVRVTGWFTSSNIEADTLFRVDVGGQIFGSAEGDERIRAYRGSFTVTDADERLVIGDATGHRFGGALTYIHALVEAPPPGG